MNRAPISGRSLSTVLLLGVGLAMQSCSPAAKLQVSYEAWELLDPGVPPLGSLDQPSVGKVLREGQGPAVAAGNLVELHLVTTAFGHFGRPAGEYDDGRGWVWIGFDHKPKADFPAGNSDFAAALIGRRQGSVQTFVPNPRVRTPAYVGGAGLVPFGDSGRYFTNKPIAGPRKSSYIYADRAPDLDVTRVEITRVCQGQASQRLVTLFDDSPISVSQDMFRTHETSEPRWMYLREAKWEGHCNDGAQASFQYGPVIVEPPPGKTKGLNISELWGPWIKDAWSKVPIGVVVK